MPTRPVLVRVALMVVLLAGLVVLADGAARHELQQATRGTAVATAAAIEQPDGGHDDE